MKKAIGTLILVLIITISNAQTKLADAVKALNGKALVGTLMNTKPVNFFLDYEDNSKSTYVKTTGGDYSNLHEAVFFINDYVATFGWVSFEEESGIITYNTKLIVADGNKIIIGRPWGVKSVSSNNPFDIVCDGAMSIDNIYAEEKIAPTEKNAIAANCKTQIVAAMKEIASKTKAEVEKLSINGNLVLIGKLRKVEKEFSSYYYSLKPKANLIASIKGQLSDVADKKQAEWESGFMQKIKSGDYKSFSDFAKELKMPNGHYEYVTVKSTYNRDTEKYTYTIGDKILTTLKEAVVTYEPEGSGIVKQLELIPQEDNHPKTVHGEVSLHFTGYTVAGDEDYVPDGYILNKRSFAVEKGIYYKGYFIIKQQGDYIEDSKSGESYYNYFAIRPVGLAPIISNRKEFDDAYYQYHIKEQLMAGTKVKF